ncbi:MAG: hypothetical protein K0V04_08970 [Deltaproteobacteria bacterium]|nr:hypothetical protein [Deltaproteobacteria bacterium]
MAESESGTDGDVEVYFADDGQDFNGDFALRLLLDSGEYRYTTISNVTIAHQATKIFAVAPGSDWEWSEVDHLWLEAFPS